MQNNDYKQLQDNLQQFQQEIFANQLKNQDYKIKIIENLGIGSYGAVFKCLADNSVIALKEIIIPISNEQEEMECYTEILKFLYFNQKFLELEYQEKLTKIKIQKYPNEEQNLPSYLKILKDYKTCIAEIIPYQKIFVVKQQNNERVKKFQLVMEYYDWGNLEDILNHYYFEENKFPSIKEIQQFVYKIILLMQNLLIPIEREIRNLRPCNILLKAPSQMQQDVVNIGIAKVGVSDFYFFDYQKQTNKGQIQINKFIEKWNKPIDYAFAAPETLLTKKGIEVSYINSAKQKELIAQYQDLIKIKKNQVKEKEKERKMIKDEIRDKEVVFTIGMIMLDIINTKLFHKEDYYGIINTNESKMLDYLNHIQQQQYLEAQKMQKKNDELYKEYQKIDNSNYENDIIAINEVLKDEKKKQTDFMNLLHLMLDFNPQMRFNLEQVQHFIENKSIQLPQFNEDFLDQQHQKLRKEILESNGIQENKNIKNTRQAMKVSAYKNEGEKVSSNNNYKKYKEYQLKTNFFRECVKFEAFVMEENMKIEKVNSDNQKQNIKNQKHNQLTLQENKKIKKLNEEIKKKNINQDYQYEQPMLPIYEPIKPIYYSPQYELQRYIQQIEFLAKETQEDKKEYQEEQKQKKKRTQELLSAVSLNFQGIQSINIKSFIDLINTLKKSSKCLKDITLNFYGCQQSNELIRELKCLVQDCKKNLESLCLNLGKYNLQQQSKAIEAEPHNDKYIILAKEIQQLGQLEVPKLTKLKLNFDGCIGIDNQVVYQIGKIISSNKNLQYISLSFEFFEKNQLNIVEDIEEFEKNVEVEFFKQQNSNLKQNQNGSNTEQNTNEKKNFQKKNKQNEFKTKYLAEEGQFRIMDQYIQLDKNNEHFVTDQIQCNGFKKILISFQLLSNLQILKLNFNFNQSFSTKNLNSLGRTLQKLNNKYIKYLSGEGKWLAQMKLFIFQAQNASRLKNEVDLKIFLSTINKIMKGEKSNYYSKQMKIEEQNNNFFENFLPWKKNKRPTIQKQQQQQEIQQKQQEMDKMRYILKIQLNLINELKQKELENIMTEFTEEKYFHYQWYNNNLCILTDKEHLKLFSYDQQYSFMKAQKLKEMALNKSISSDIEIKLETDEKQKIKDELQFYKLNKNRKYDLQKQFDNFQQQKEQQYIEFEDQKKRCLLF